MTDTPIEERKFTDQEVREILKKAVEKSPSRALTKGEGLSLAELKAIGEEVGIDPARLEDAARAVAQHGTHRINPIVGAPMTLHFERRVEGTLDADNAPEVLALIRRTMGRQGEVDEIHGMLEWSAKGDSGDRYVTVSSKDGLTTVRSAANLTNAAVLTYLPGGMVGLLTSFIGLIRYVKTGSDIGLIVALTALPILYPILRRILSKFSRAESEKLQRVVDELARMAEASGE